MNQKIRDELLWRATIVENSESLIKSCSRNNKDQLSLFAETKNETIDLKVPQDVNYEELLQKEVDLMGVALTYNIQDKYILHFKRFCNNTLRSINELSESQGKIVFIAKIDTIEYCTSLAGNNYARILWKDSDSECRMFLFGDQYQKLISKTFKGRYYLCECSYNKDKESLSIVNFKAIEDIEITDSVSTIVLNVKDDIESVVSLRNYVFTKMIGSQYDYITRYKDKNGVEDLKKARHYLDMLIESFEEFKD